MKILFICSNLIGDTILSSGVFKHFIDQNENAIYLSHRHLSRITKIDYPSGEIIWNMGLSEEYMSSGQEHICSDLEFSFQHHIQCLEDGDLLFFDNGNLDQSIFQNETNTSRALRVEIIDNNYLLNYDWPGNVRELRNLIERIAILSPGDDNEKLMNIIKESLSKSIEDEFSVTETLTVPLKEARESFEKKYLISQLKKFSGNISKTAKFIGMERSALHRKLKLLGVKDLN